MSLSFINTMRACQLYSARADWILKIIWGGRKYMTEEDKNLLRYIIGLALTAILVVLFTLIASA